MLNNTQNAYGLLAKAFHWVTGLIILGLLSLGFYMEGLEGTPFKFGLYGWHKSFGALVLFLVIFRLGWKFASVRVESLPTHQQWEKLLAKGAHILLYLAMFAMPLTGWLMSSAAGYPVKMFGLELPALIEKNKELGGFFNQAHGIIAYALIGLLVLHVAGAFKHHFLDKDETIQRMTLPELGFVGGVGLAIIAAVAIGLPVLLVLI